MKILDRYITKNIIVTFLVTVLIFSLLYILIDSACNLDEFIDRQVSMKIIAQYYLLSMPFIMVQLASMACLIAVLFTFANLNTHNEVIALRASGMSFWQISKPALCFGLVVAAILFALNEGIVPDSQEKLKELKNENLMLAIDRKRKKQANITDLTFYGQENRLYYIDTFDPNKDELHGITIIEFSKDQRPIRKIVALKGIWSGMSSKYLWKLQKCHITEYTGVLSGPQAIKVYEEKLFDIRATPQDFLKQRLNVETMNIRELNEYIRRFSNSGAQRAVNNLRVDLHQKISFPFGNFVILLVGLPFVLMSGSRKAQTFMALAIAIGIGFFYYLFNAVGLALGKGGIVDPVLSAWLAPLIFCGMAYFIIKINF